MIIAIVGTFLGCLIGFIVGIIQTIPVDKRDSAVKKTLVGFLKFIMACYVEFFRGTPMMVQAMFIYYGSAYLFNINMSMWFAAFFVVSINTGAYMAETVRGGILSVDEGQTEAAKAIGMTHVQTMMNVILPQALRNIMPQIGNNPIINIKDTCVLSIIGIVELFYTTKRRSRSLITLTFESFTIAMVMYFILTFVCSRLLRLLEHKMEGPQNYDLATTDTLAHTSGLYSYPKKKGGEMIMSEKILEVKHLGKAFGSNQVLRDIDFSVSPGDVTCIIGPSGSGKSTLLRCLNMLETPSTGEINYHGTDITSKNVNVPEYRSKGRYGVPEFLTFLTT